MTNEIQQFDFSPDNTINPQQNPTNTLDVKKPQQHKIKQREQIIYQIRKKYCERNKELKQNNKEFSNNATKRKKVPRKQVVANYDLSNLVYVVSMKLTEKIGKKRNKIRI